MSLERLRIRNFQSWERLTLELDERITSIIGPNDIGKSAIIRALRWVCLSELDDSGFIHWGEKFALSRLTLEGVTITRRREDTNQYFLDDKEFTAVRNNVPEEIARHINVSDLNFQEQHDSPFWFSSTAGQVSKQLNKIIDLEIIDRTLSNIASDVRHARSVVTVSEERLQDARRKREDSAFAVELDEQLSKLEAQKAQIAGKASSVERLRFLIEQVYRHKDYKRNAEEPAVDGQKLLSDWKSLESRREHYKSLERVLEKVREQENTYGRLVAEIASIRKQLDREEVCPLCQQPLKTSLSD